MNKSWIKILLGLIIVLLAILIFRSIDRPVKFDNKINERRAVIIERLKDIRTAQNLFRTQNNRFTGSFDTLVDFIKNGRIPEVRIVPDPKDTTFTRTISDTIGYISIFDSLYDSKYTTSNLNAIRYVPYSKGGKEEFFIGAGSINKGGLDISVFEVSTPMETYTYDLDKQYVVNRKKEIEDKNKYPGLKVGSMTEATIDGNWE